MSDIAAGIAGLAAVALVIGMMGNSSKIAPAASKKASDFIGNSLENIKKKLQEPEPGQEKTDQTDQVEKSEEDGSGSDSEDGSKKGDGSGSESDDSESEKEEGAVKEDGDSDSESESGDSKKGEKKGNETEDEESDSSGSDSEDEKKNKKTPKQAATVPNPFVQGPTPYVAGPTPYVAGPNPFGPTLPRTFPGTPNQPVPNTPSPTDTLPRPPASAALPDTLTQKPPASAALPDTLSQTGTLTQKPPASAALPDTLSQTASMSSQVEDPSIAIPIIDTVAPSKESTSPVSPSDTVTPTEEPKTSDTVALSDTTIASAEEPKTSDTVALSDTIVSAEEPKSSDTVALSDTIVSAEEPKSSDTVALSDTITPTEEPKTSDTVTLAEEPESSDTVALSDTIVSAEEPKSSDIAALTDTVASAEEPDVTTASGTRDLSALNDELDEEAVLAEKLAEDAEREKVNQSLDEEAELTRKLDEDRKRNEVNEDLPDEIEVPDLNVGDIEPQDTQKAVVSVDGEEVPPDLNEPLVREKEDADTVEDEELPSEAEDDPVHLQYEAAASKPVVDVDIKLDDNGSPLKHDYSGITNRFDCDAYNPVVAWMKDRDGLEFAGIDPKKVDDLRRQGTSDDAIDKLIVENINTVKQKLGNTLCPKLNGVRGELDELINQHVPMSGGAATKTEKVHMTGAGLLALTVAMAFIGNL